MNTDFPTREEIKKEFETPKLNTHYDYLAEQIKQLELDKFNFENVDYDKIEHISEKSKIYFWIRVYLSNEIDIEPGDDVTITYTYSNEKLNTKFICYSKKGVVSNNNTIIQFDNEDDTKVLCLMVDKDKIDYDSEDIPFIRSLFKESKFFTYQMLRRADLVIKNETQNYNIEYYDIDF
jgi:hypothetical protein